MYVWEKQTVFFPKMCTNAKDVVDVLGHIREILFKLKKNLYACNRTTF